MLQLTPAIASANRTTRTLGHLALPFLRFRQSNLQGPVVSRMHDYLREALSTLVYSGFDAPVTVGSRQGLGVTHTMFRPFPFTPAETEKEKLVVGFPKSPMMDWFGFQ